MLKELAYLSRRNTKERQFWNLILTEERHAIRLHTLRRDSAHKLALKEELVEFIFSITFSI